ncbi:MAG: aminotransferase class V-fold PLP-dependent enzyme [Ardenticatenaceae bacterium]|nr:aminotransferase class V-fold PLP-dependent enzyme [Ardenticatenaceae bacterium]HBY92548.1 aminotransferase [Chloroflexota bacterium]
MQAAPSIECLREYVVGGDCQVPLLDGSYAPYINFDNAASTPVLRPVYDTVNHFLHWYSSVHRGAGYKSRLATKAYDDAREMVAEFVAARFDQHVVVFCRNTTEAINKLMRRLELGPDDVVLTTLMEHHSNDLPWRLQSHVRHTAVDQWGMLDEDDFDRQLATYAGRVRLVAVTGASNVTGLVNPIHHLAEKAHAAGALILVDAAQLAPHRQIRMLSLDDPRHLDYVALSAHKMYAPYGSGALIGRRDCLEQGTPAEVGGGTVKIVTTDSVEWAALPDREEAGSPNVVGAVALAAAMQTLQSIGMESIAAHERQLIAYALKRLAVVEGITLYGPKELVAGQDRVGVISFNVHGVPHSKVASILSLEGGIGVRNGCFCAHPYVTFLLRLSDKERQQYRAELQAGDKSRVPGLVRISFGCYNTQDEVDVFVDILRRIVAGEYQGHYSLDPVTGDYVPDGFEAEFERVFSLRHNALDILSSRQPASS